METFAWNMNDSLQNNSEHQEEIFFANVVIYRSYQDSKWNKFLVFIFLDETSFSFFFVI